MKTIITIVIPESYTEGYHRNLYDLIRGIVPNDCFITSESKRGEDE